MTDWLKQNAIPLAILLVAIIILFQTCNKIEYAPVIIFPDSTDKAIDKKLDSLLSRKPIIENNETNIHNKNEYETKNYLSLPDSLKPHRAMQLARELLK